MPDWPTILISVALSTLASAILIHLIYARRWRRSIALLLGSLRNYRDLRRAADRLSKRPRRRYIVFEVISTGSPTQGEVEKAIIGAIKENLGTTGVALSQASVVYYNESRGRGILRVTQEYRYQVIGILGLVRRIGGRKAIVIPIAVTGSIKRAKRLIG